MRDEMQHTIGNLEKLLRALKKREPIRAADTNALRVVDGRGDGFEDLEIDDFAGHWLAQTRGEIFPQWLAKADLERFGAKSLFWKKLAQSKEPPAFIAGEKIVEPFVARENGASFWIDFQAGYSQGLFLDQRENRRAVRERSAGKTVLNCFAYTCAFGVCAALGGAAQSVNVDLSKHYLEWGKRNYLLNNVSFADSAHDFIFGDVLEWLERFAKKRRVFDLVILDPPTFSRNKRGEIFQIETGFPKLIRAAEKLLSKNGAIFCSTNQRGLSQADFRKLLARGFDNPSVKRRISLAPMPPDFCGEQYLKAAWIES